MPAADVKPPAEETTDAFDESDKHSRLKTFLLIVAMVGGFGLFVWNMTNFVNNMRLDSQGYPVNAVYEMEDLNDFMNTDNRDDSAATNVDDQTESEVSTDATRDGPESEPDDISSDIADDDADTLRQKAQDALNEAALVRQELKNAEDMLDSSLQREAELQNQLNTLNGGNGQ